MNIWQFIERHPVWTVIFFCIATSTIETIALAIARRK